MPRPAKPWRDASDGWWKIKIAGRKRKLVKGPDDADTKARAVKAWHELMAAEGRGAPAGDAAESGLSINGLFLLFIRWCKKERPGHTVDGYYRNIKTFEAMYGDMPAAAIRPLHVQRWVDSQAGWESPTSRRNGITAIKRMFNWARKQGYVAESPIRDMERPTARKRTKILSPDQVDTILGAVKDREFRNFLAALWETGARPGEVMQLTATQVRGGRWIVPNKTARKTERPERIIELTPRMVELCAELATRHPTGPLFRNTTGTGWTRHAVAHRFGRLRARLGFGGEATSYAYRHRFVTDALLAGVPVAVVSELVGHTNTKMVMEVYSHLREHREHLSSAVARFRPGASGAPDAKSPAPDGDPTDGPGGPPRPKPRARRPAARPKPGRRNTSR